MIFKRVSGHIESCPDGLEILTKVQNGVESFQMTWKVSRWFRKFSDGSGSLRVVKKVFRQF